MEIIEDERVSVNRDYAPHGSYELTIHDVRADDGGSYTVAASNNAGTEECIAGVTTKGRLGV